MPIEFLKVLMKTLYCGISLILAVTVAANSAEAADRLPRKTEPSKLFWIGAAPTETKKTSVAFETEFSLERAPSNARLKIAATDGCDVLVNGTPLKVPGEAKSPQAIEVQKQLVAGDNKIRIESHSGAVVLSLTVAEIDGTRRRLETNKSWKMIREPGAKPESATEVWVFGQGPKGDVFASLKPAVCPPDQITVPEGFKVELLHALDDDEGSWVAMCTDPRGRLIASDAGGSMVRITPPSLGADATTIKIEPIDLPVGHANGLLWAFDSLYVMVCQEGVYGTGSGVYRVRDTNGDDIFDSVELLRKIHGSGDHGPHALLLSPDGKSITVVCGNSTRPTEWQHYQIPPIFKDDQTLPKLNGHGFMSGAGAPAGYIARMTPDGKEWTLVSSGLRNQYDAAFNRHGDLFTYDADMEWDLGMPWYRPTRVCHVIDGAEWGWRSVSGKWPEYYVDSLPPVINIGRGSPTGIAFGYGTKFPVRYQEALFLSDWTYGKLIAVHLKEDGSTYAGRQETFLEGRGVKPTDIAIGNDGALYFCGGSRRSNSALYRVTYVGKESTETVAGTVDAQARTKEAELRRLRERLAASYHATNDDAISLALENLGHEDRFIRFAARTSLEFKPFAAWKERALKLSLPRAIVQAVLALARLEDVESKDAAFALWESLPLTKADDETKLDAIRALQVAAIRFGEPEAALKQRLLETIHRSLPASDDRYNVEAAQLLVRWKSPLAAKLIFPLFEKAASQEEQIGYAASLRFVTGDWPKGAKEKYFRWFLLERFHKAGHLQKFITDIRKDAVATLSDVEKTSLQSVLDAAPEVRPEPPLASRLFVKNWQTEELFADVKELLNAKRDLVRGKQLYRETGCLACHLFKGEGGVTGPDLTLAANKFSARELIEHVVEPSKVVSDQYAATIIETEDGTVLSGRVVGADADKVQIQPNLYQPSDVRTILRKDIAEMQPSKISLMPVGLFNTCQPDEVADVIALIQAGLRAAIPAPPSRPIAGVPAPIAHWQLEDEDSEARDSVGKHHGSIHGATSQAGKFGKGLLFDRAKQQQIAIPYSPDFEISTYTVSAWVRLTKEPTFSGIVGTRLGGEFTFDMKVNADKVHGDIGDGSRWINTAINFYKGDVGSNGQGGDLAIERWYLITFVIDNEAKEARLYLDTDRKKTIPFKGESRLMRSGHTMTIGNTGKSEHMDGVIDDVRIWNHALTDEQVGKIFVE